MNSYDINIGYDLKAGKGLRAKRLAEMFGVGSLLTRREVVKGIEICVDRGKVTYISGPSGSGKSSVMRELDKRMSSSGCDICDVGGLDFDRSHSLVDSMNVGTLDEAMKVLCKVGLSELYLMMASYSNLSVGEQFRYRLAQAIVRRPGYIFIDEFCSSLDDVSASILCTNICRVAKEYNIGFVVAGSNKNLGEHLECNFYYRIDDRE